MICNQSAGVIIACVQEELRLFAVVERMTLQVKLSSHSDVWRRDGSVTVWPADRLEQVLAWIPDGDLTTVLRIHVA